MRAKRCRSRLFSCLLLAAAAACGGGGQGDSDASTDDGDNQITGGLQKGPFLLGSTVEIALLDAQGNPTGLSFETTTADDLGRFSIVLTDGGSAQIVGTGYYFNEILGDLSASVITMHALADVSASGTQSVYVNALTQMAYGRALALFQGGTPLADAVGQAEGELRAALGIIHPGSTAAAGTAMNILGGDTADNEYLLALSCILGQAASMSGGSPDANLQEIINTVSADLTADGAIDGDMLARFAEAEKALDPAACMANTGAYLAENGSEAEVPDIDNVVDTDKDGVANAADPDDDGDGVDDAEDCAPLDPTLQYFLVDGATCVPDTDDDDGDGVPDLEDCAPLDPDRHDLLADGVTCCVDDDDDDDDGFADLSDCAPLDAESHSYLTDGSGVCAVDDDDDDDDADPDATDCAALNPTIQDCWVDAGSGLQWEIEIWEGFDFDTAVARCDALSLDGYDDWRLPNIDELRTLVVGCAATTAGGACGVTVDCAELTCTEPMLDCEGCPGGGGAGPSGYYQPPGFPVLNTAWSSTELTDSLGEAWAIEFYQARVTPVYKADMYEGRCVRTAS